jgi:hypothetical protein
MRKYVYILKPKAAFKKKIHLYVVEQKFWMKKHGRQAHNIKKACFRQSGPPGDEVAWASKPGPPHMVWTFMP